MKILNLYAGLGGNRKLWTDCEVTAVELDPRIAAVYRRLYPKDIVIEADAHAHLLQHHTEFDFIWTSPPCQKRSRMNKATRHKRRQYVDMELYQQVLLLRNFFKGKWVVENVEAYFDELIEPTAKIGRHVFWSNFDIPSYAPPRAAKGFHQLVQSRRKARAHGLAGHPLRGEHLLRQQSLPGPDTEELRPSFSRRAHFQGGVLASNHGGRLT